jgi:hypothetical protein
MKSFTKRAGVPHGVAKAIFMDGGEVPLAFFFCLHASIFRQSPQAHHACLQKVVHPPLNMTIRLNQIKLRIAGVV